MHILSKLLHTPATKDIKTDTVYVLAAALGWTLLREVAMRLLLRPVAARYVISVSPDESSSAKENAATTNGKPAAGSTATNGTSEAAVRKESFTKRDRRRREHLQKRNEARFCEQGWSVIYYTCSFSVGLYLSLHQPWWPLRVKEFWTDYPEHTVSALLKHYYLAQTAFYLHQVYVLFAEARRKDHWQMFAHHIITISLQYASYATHFHRVGVAIMLLLDPSDILLSAAKMLRYVGFQTVCDIFFGLFLLSWLFLRHILFCIVIKSAIFDVPYNPKADSRNGDFATPYVTGTLAGLLVVLQFILLIWFVTIVKVAYRVITGSGAADARSDDEDELEDAPSSAGEADSENKPRNGALLSTTAHNGVVEPPAARAALRQRSTATG